MLTQVLNIVLSCLVLSFVSHSCRSYAPQQRSVYSDTCTYHLISLLLHTELNTGSLQETNYLISFLRVFVLLNEVKELPLSQFVLNFFI
jgi:hypothetical protein